MFWDKLVLFFAYGASLAAICCVLSIFCLLFQQHIEHIMIRRKTPNTPNAIPIFAPPVRCGPHVRSPGIPQRPWLSVKLKLALCKSLPPRAAGTLPDKELLLRYSLLNEVNCPSVSGIDPLKELYERSNTSKLGIAPSEDGMAPLILFPLRFKLCR